MNVSEPAKRLRLNKFLATNHGVSRRQADELIADGRVSVNGETAVIAQQVSPSDHIVCDSKEIKKNTQSTTILFHKPAGYVCSRKQQGNSPTIYSLLPEKYQKLKTIGRLDRDSSGLILLSNDGDLNHHLTHPKFHKTKEYQVKLNKPLQPLHRQMISDFGIILEDGKSQLLLERLKDDDENAWKIKMHEGRNRQIRRTFAALGYEVVSLHRTTFGVYQLADIKPAQLVLLEQN